MSCLKKFSLWLFTGLLICIIGISDVFAFGGTNLNYTIQHYFVRTMSFNNSTQVGSYEYTKNPFLTSNITENGWLPRLIGFDGVASINFNSSYVYTLTYRFNYPSSTDVFDWKTYLNYATFKIYGSTPDLFSCSIINNTSSYTDVKCTFKRTTSDNYFFFYFDFYDNYNALHTYGIPYNFSTFELSFSNISLTYTQDTGQIQVEQNNIIINQNNETNKKLDEQNKTSKSILGKIGDILNYLNPFSENFFAYKLIELIINGLKSLFIPKNLDFLENFKDTMSEKLGFIASIPLQLIDFIIDLKDYAFSTPTSLTFPTISILGYSFWNEMTIDITVGLSWVSAIKYVTDIICVILCVNTLRKFYNSFFGGGEN